ncbi:SusC/RagA family TonB-linked outer membrane protein [Reichenbachiella ulvae]|uniref:TonB-dependent receptor n=1 Tax=Reichenbachiella ulvae TaxID=2980104 RepID=A0ABT3CXG2_9BACT|nr:TonB-dependent receptor [Reichenbachiella ulvae]MCV9387898.1 TonB-dependent receptor [Reichenbachiella ulvae]
MNRKYTKHVLLLLCLVMSGFATLAQSITVSGKILASDLQDALPGVTVLQKGTTKGTVTNMDGEFSIEVPSDATLSISYVGYLSKEIPVNGRSTIDIVLDADVQALEEVIVVGYGEQAKETLVSSVSSVQGKELQKSPQPNLSNSFAGRISGVIATTASGEPGFDGSQLLIRGQGSNGDNSPLIVVDGVASQLGGLERLDPNNIQSISVLKDASAAIYGSRAANGVILVTTKGGVKSEPVFTFTYNHGFVRPTRIPEMASSAQYGEILNEIAYYNNPGGGLNQTYTEEELELFRNGSDPVNYANTDWLNEVIAPISYQDQQSLSIGGGGETTQYFVSLGRRHQEGIYKNGITEFEQINLRTNVDVNATDYLKIGAKLNVRQEKGTYSTTSAEGVFRAAYRAQPSLVPYYDGVGYGIGSERANNPLVLVTDTPGKDTQPKTVLNTILDFDYKLPFAESFSVKGFVSVDKSFKEQKKFELPYVVYQPVPNSDPMEFSEVPNNIASPQLYQRRDNEQLVTAHAALHFNKAINDHYVSAFVAYEQSEYKSDYMEAFRRGFNSDAVDELNQGPEGVDENENPYGTNGGDSFQESRRNYFGRVSYDYAGKYLLEGQLRYDGSSKFAEGNQYGFFWSVSGGWRISEEAFFNVEAINNLKIRASYGVIGNDKIPDFQFLNRYQNIGAGYVVDGVPVTRYVISQLANENITWEESKKLDIGLETTVFQHFTIEADYFHETRDGLLIEPRDLPWVSGIINEWDATNDANDIVPAIVPQQNIGTVENSGFEGQISYDQSINNLNFFISANATYAKSKVVDIRDPEVIEWKKAEGKPLFAGLYYEAVGIFRTPEDIENNPSLPNNKVGDLMYKDVDGNGEITANDQVRSDLTNVPQLVYGVSAGLDWKSFDFSFLLQGQGLSEQYFLPESGTIGNYTKTWADNRYSPSNIAGSYPRVDTRTSSSVNGGNEFRTDFWLVNTSFVRLKNIELGYSLPVDLISKVRLTSARIYVNALNLATFTASDDFDPEVTNIQGHAYPQHKIFNVGATIKF